MYNFPVVQPVVVDSSRFNLWLFCSKTRWRGRGGRHVNLCAGLIWTYEQFSKPLTNLTLFRQHFFFILAIISLSLECDSRLSQWLWDNDSVLPDGTKWSLKLMPKPCQLNSGKQQKLGAISCSLRKWAGPLNRHTGSFKSIFSLFICCPSHLLTWRVPLFDIYATWDS